MCKYLFIIVLFIGCTSSEKVYKEELSIIYENAKDFYKKKDYDLAYKNASNYLEIVQAKGYLKETGNALNLLGAISRKRGQPPEALEFYLKALDIKEVLRDSISMSNTYDNIGIVYAINGAYEEALRYQLKCIKIRENANDQNLMQVSYRNIGLAYKNNKQYQKALHYFSKCLEISKAQHHEKRTADILNHMAICYEESHNYSKAILYYNQVVAIWEKLRDGQEVAGIYNNLAIVHMNIDSLSKAISYALKSIEIKEQEGVEDEKVYTYNTLSDIYHKQGLTDKVIEYAEKSIPIAEKYHMEEELLKAYSHAWEGYLLQGNDKKSIDYLKKSITLDKYMDEQREHFYEIAISELKQFEEVEKQHAIHKASTLNTMHLDSQRKDYLIAIFIGLIIFVGVGIVLSKKHARLQELMIAFPIHIRTSLSNIGGISFYSKIVPEEATVKLEEVDRILNVVNAELGFFMDKVKNGVTTLERFDPSIDINIRLKEFEKLAKKRNLLILSDIRGGCFIHTDKKIYLAAFEWLLKSSLKRNTTGNIVEVMLWSTGGSLWLEISDSRPNMQYYYEDMTLIKKLKKLGGIVTVNPKTKGRIEIAISFNLA